MTSTAYSLTNLVDDLRAAVSRPGDAMEPKLEAGAVALSRLLRNPDAIAPYRWVLEHGRGPWQIHRDEKLGFVVVLQVKPRGGVTNVHHHGEAWSLYGVVEGDELIHRYGRVDSSDPRLSVVRYADHPVHSGDVEVEPANTIHNETTGPERDTLAIIVRGRDTSTVLHEFFDLETGVITQRFGPKAQEFPAR